MSQELWTNVEENFAAVAKEDGALKAAVKQVCDYFFLRGAGWESSVSGSLMFQMFLLELREKRPT